MTPNGSTFHWLKMKGGCDVPNFIEIKEDATGNILNNSITTDVVFSWSIIEVSGHPIGSLSFENQQKIKEYFSSGRNNASVWINVVKAIDKESLNLVIGLIVSFIKIRVTCGATSTDMTVVVAAVNEFPPEFRAETYYVNVSESTSVGRTVYTINDVIDRDVDGPSDRTYTVSRALEEFDGTPYFEMESISSPIIVLRRVIDYDAIVDAGKVPTFLINVNVADMGGKTDKALFNFTIINEDDQPPTFIPKCGIDCTTCYTTSVPLGHRGPLTNFTPAAISAVDLDQQHTMRYSIIQDSEGYHASFEINANTGVLTAISALRQTSVLLITVTENSALQRSAITTVLVKIADKGPMIQVEPTGIDKSEENIVTVTPTVSKSVEKEEDNHILIILIVVAIYSLLVTLALLSGSIVYCKGKKMRAVIHAKAGFSPFGSVDTTEEGSGQKQETMQSYGMLTTSSDAMSNQLPPASTEI
ncbi:protocadherin-15-like [Saccostrea cucullata]|uniref:protocadherin-15-like n=1 Tax=Saccostrea cuccullata TaxID=36930 RepID=UPI002ED57CA1